MFSDKINQKHFKHLICQKSVQKLYSKNRLKICPKIFQKMSKNSIFVIYSRGSDESKRNTDDESGSDTASDRYKRRMSYVPPRYRRHSDQITHFY